MSDIKQSLIAAIRDASVEKVRKVIHSVDLSKSLQTSDTPDLLYEALEMDSDEIMELLLENGAPIDIEEGLLFASTYGYIKIVEMLLDRGANINAKIQCDSEALLWAADGGYIEIVQIFLDRGADINAKDQFGSTALLHAARGGCIEMFKMLLDRGADINAKNHYNSPAFLLAAEGGYTEIVQIVLDKGADINVKDNYGSTGPLLAAKGGYIEIVQMLLDRGADINAKNQDDSTALQLAIQYAREEVIKFLTQYIIFKINVTGFYVDEQNLDLIRRDVNFHNECETEIQTMKSEKIENSTISFFHILMKSTNQLAACIRNISVVEVLESEDYKMKFPIYASVISKQYVKGKRRAELLAPATEALSYLVDYKLPQDCLDVIINYLSNDDLKSVI